MQTMEIARTAAPRLFTNGIEPHPAFLGRWLTNRPGESGANESSLFMVEVASSKCKVSEGYNQDDDAMAIR